jgi:hypothetical protein
VSLPQLFLFVRASTWSLTPRYPSYRLLNTFLSLVVTKVLTPITVFIGSQNVRTRSILQTFTPDPQSEAEKFSQIATSSPWNLGVLMCLWKVLCGWDWVNHLEIMIYWVQNPISVLIIRKADRERERESEQEREIWGWQMRSRAWCNVAPSQGVPAVTRGGRGKKRLLVSRTMIREKYSVSFSHQVCNILLWITKLPRNIPSL